MLLRENLSFDKANMIVETTEDEKGTKKLYMEGRFLVGDEENLNGRNYPVSEIRKAVNQINEAINKGESILGECDHPSELTVNLDRTSHVIEKMWMDGNMGMGKLRIIPTPHGEIIRTLIEAGIKLGVSSRGSGNVNSMGQVEDFDLITVDIVNRPSGPDCFPTPIYEAFEGRKGDYIHELAKAVKHDQAAQKYLMTEAINWINNLK